MKKKFNKTDLPHELPVFPLSNAIFFPKTLLPLNIFEPRYKQMTEHAVDGNKLIGMVQSNQKVNEKGKAEVYNIGCVGYIEFHSKTPDGRYLINLKGISRFKIKEEINTNNLYRKFSVDYNDFLSDFDEQKTAGINTIELIKKTKKLFEQYQLSTDWKVVEKVETEQLINSLSMICPFTISEKQRLLETKNLIDRNEILNKIINFYVLGNNENNKNIH
tara:strand:+ start:656 stop:1309 length:654 start_codon:yes stop_codon:yes gene_type:complete